MTYINCKKEINIICLLHNKEYEQRPDTHLRGKQACPDCKNERKINSGKKEEKLQNNLLKNQ